MAVPDPKVRLPRSGGPDGLASLGRWAGPRELVNLRLHGSAGNRIC